MDQQSPLFKPFGLLDPPSQPQDIRSLRNWPLLVAALAIAGLTYLV